MREKSPEFEGWRRYFEAQARRDDPIPWDRDRWLTEREREAISASIRTFQRGESSSGRRFVAAARAWAARGGDPSYPEAVERFVAEENRHGAMLGRFMDLQSIARARMEWTDAIFRGLRRIGGIEGCTTVLLAAELIAKPYYKALLAATGSPVLRSICQRILWDEVQHVYFQTQAIRRMREDRPRWRRALTDALYRGFFAVVARVVWRQHRKVFIAGGYGRKRFLAEATCELEEALQLIDRGWREEFGRHVAELQAPAGGRA